MSHNGRTVYVFLVLLITMWLLELGGGIFLIRWFWGTAWFSWGEPGQQSMAELLTKVGGYLHELPNGRYELVSLHWTPAGVLAAFVAVFIAVHVIYAFWCGLLSPFLDRWRLGARKPTSSEREQFGQALVLLNRGMAASLTGPYKWLVADGMGLQMRWIGYVLVIDRELFGHRFFVPLLAVELGHANSEDRLARRLYAMIPSTQAIMLLMFGLPVAVGHIITYPLWAAYWRGRIYAADSYAALRLGQGYQLIQALENVYLKTDQATRGGRFLRPVPYVAQRIDRIRAMLMQVAPPGSWRVI